MRSEPRRPGYARKLANLTPGVLPFGIAEREADVVRFFRTQT
jgi:hypothetical protein